MGSEKKQKYTFKTSGYLTINGEDSNTLDVELSNEDIAQIRDWFIQRGMRWIGYVPKEFRKHSPELYDRLYQAEVDRTNSSDPVDPYLLECLTSEESEEEDSPVEYDPDIDPCDNDCAWMPLLWPNELFDEMKINIPNANIWAKLKDVKGFNGMGYPIYLEDNYVDELRNILESTIWYKESKIYSIDIENLADKHQELKNIIKERLNDTLINNYDYTEDELQDLVFIIYELSLRRDEK